MSWAPMQRRPDSIGSSLPRRAFAPEGAPPKRLWNYKQCAAKGADSTTTAVKTGKQGRGADKAGRQFVAGYDSAAADALQGDFSTAIALPPRFSETSQSCGVTSAAPGVGSTMVSPFFGVQTAMILPSPSSPGAEIPSGGVSAPFTEVRAATTRV